ncbi:hypothetical protein FS764_16585 [Agrobacterium vitis]|uniref:hypothetical protein n=1 Tax=Agrobacterium vitis TaxID=373 RepID=UPI0012E96DE7|nr:hypothetical protein [Agrobacterium vitis]MCF1468525.1 hypothetical protein [Agrobacterium vitis]MVA33631.1 hypothetical protein [Agrobacterium vitis]NSY12423.1 hypothetical protein [Agrobacterium vitis]NSY22252.1 hypothetical protein [Agrobacterium vitis]NTA21953.1 hypothetical protein [Agrobacterium vitis]
MTGCRCGSVSIDHDRYKRLSCVQKMSFWMEAHACGNCGGVAAGPEVIPPAMVTASAYERCMGREVRP